jgi:hypothetical protein
VAVAVATLVQLQEYQQTVVLAVEEDPILIILAMQVLQALVAVAQEAPPTTHYCKDKVVLV